MSVLRDYLLLRAHAGYATYWVSWVVLLAILFGGVFLFAAVLPAPGAFIIALAVVVGIAWLVICSARARDMGVPGICGVLTLVPVVGFIAFLWLGLSRSNPR